MIENIVNKINEYNLIKNNSTIYVGVSGGADSMCLLDILYNIKEKDLIEQNFSLCAVHINHMLRGDDATDDQLHVEKYCNERNIKCFTYIEDIKALSILEKKTIEQTARDFRFSKFNSLLNEQNGDKIALAHNISDNAETMLMHLFRGSGLHGLCAMGYLDANIIRPLLESSRLDIEKYLDENEILYKTDKTNLETIYQRNKIRLEAMPYIEENFNNNIVNSLNNSRKSFSLDNDFLQQNADLEYEKLYKIKNNILHLNIEKLKKLHKSILIRIFQKAFLYVNGSIVDLSYKNILDLIDLLYKESGKKIALNSDVVAFKGYEDIIFYVKNDFDFDTDFCYNIKDNVLTYSEEGLIYILINQDEIAPKMDSLSCIKSETFYFLEKQSFFLRNKRLGDKIYLNSIRGHKSIKKYFQDEKVDSIWRNRTVFLATNENLLMILDNNMIKNDNFNDDSLKFKYCIHIFK